MKATLHAIAGALALLTISSFMLGTLYSELLADHETVLMVKRLIVMPGLFILVPCLAVTGASGFSLAKGRKARLIDVKRKRMPFIAANGILILIPCALTLRMLAASGQFGELFYAIQVLELLAGAVNFTLLGLNMRDGLRLSGRLRKSSPAMAS